MRPLLALVTMLLLSLAPTRAASGTGTDAYQVIVNPSIAATAVDRGFLKDVFLKKVTRWPDGTVIHPADLTASSPVRRRFSDEVLERSVESVRNYWQQRIFSGRDVPPPELASDDEVISYVLKHEGGIAYVSGTAKLNGTKVLACR